MKGILCGMGLMLVLTNSGWAAGADTVEVEVLSKTTSSWNGTDLPKYTSGQPEITILRITVPPGVRLPRHKHPVINAGVLLKGQLTVVSEDEEILHLRAGDAIVELVDKWHYGKNEGTSTAEIIVFYAGINGEPITTKK